MYGAFRWPSLVFFDSQIFVIFVQISAVFRTAEAENQSRLDETKTGRTSRKKYGCGSSEEDF